MKDKNEILWIKRGTKDRLYKIKSEFPRQTFDNVVNKLVDDFEHKHLVKMPNKRKNEFWGRE